jgi:hypothetical protein
MGIILPFIISGTDFPGWGILIVALSFLVFFSASVFILVSIACNLINPKEQKCCQD